MYSRRTTLALLMPWALPAVEAAIMPQGRHQHVAWYFLLLIGLSACQHGCSWMGQAQVVQQAPDGCLPPLHRIGWVNICLATHWPAALDMQDMDVWVIDAD